jgi:[ribosomal protein S5]-alanine N-acetyltransferase
MTGTGKAFQLETERLVLEIPDPSFASEMVVYLKRNRDFHNSTMPKPSKEVFTKIYWESNFKNWREEHRAISSLGLVYLLKDDPAPTPVGDCIFENIARGSFYSCQLKFKLDQDYVGHGFMEEALKRSIEYVFNELGLHRIETFYQTENVRCGALLKQLGFIVEGLSRDYLILNGVWSDHLRASLINPHDQKKNRKK